MASEDEGPDQETDEAAEELVEKARVRTEESGVFGPQGHPWVSEVMSALESYKHLRSAGEGTELWLDELRSRTIFWCSQVLAGVAPSLQNAGRGWLRKRFSSNGYRASTNEQRNDSFRTEFRLNGID